MTTTMNPTETLAATVIATVVRQDQPQDVRVRVWLAMAVEKEGRKKGLSCAVDIVRFWGKGMAIEWEYCFGCPGYADGGPHAACMFHAYDRNRIGGDELVFDMDLAGFPEGIRFLGKVTYVHQEGGREMIGVMFTRIPAEAYKHLAYRFPNAFAAVA
jgi:hypothetical protein